MNELTDLMERTTDDLRPDVAALVAGGMTRGRRLRVRRRLTTGAAALAAVGAVGAAAAFAPSLVAGSPDRDPGTDSSRVIASNPEPTAPRLPSRSALANGAVVELPAGRARLIESRGGERDGFVVAAWKFWPASGGAAGRVDVLVERVEMPRVATGPEPTLDPRDLNDPEAFARFKVQTGRMPTEIQPYSPASACRNDVRNCHQTADGAWVSTFTWNEPLSGGGDSDITSAHATLWTDDGFAISATSYNAMGEKDTPATRMAPVIDDAGLLAMVRAAHLG